MPKRVRSTRDIEAVKENILTEASVIILESGFESLSMRKLASKLGMTAANIYNYFSNKDELYLAIQTKGFALLADEFATAEKRFSAPEDKIRAYIDAYIEFGVTKPNYYDVMFSRNTPKFMDYLGTKTEPLAHIEKTTALRVIEIAIEAIEMLPGGKTLDTKYLAIKAWTQLHGVVSLLNTRVLREVDEDTDTFIERISRDLMQPFNPNQE